MLLSKLGVLAEQQPLEEEKAHKHSKAEEY
jgi:hypothetical protein